MNPIITIDELFEIRTDNNLIIVNASNGKEAKENYDARHLENALFVSLNDQLAEIKEDFSIGGRHPLPKITDFAQVLAGLGITKSSHVVIYDDKNGSNAAARFWWMLRAAGHKKVQVLNGGIQAAEKRNFPMSSAREKINTAEPYEVKDWTLGTIEMDQVEKVMEDRNFMIIDVREERRYNGETEPIDLVAGHIPNAINIPFTENLDENGFFLSPQELKSKYRKVFGNTKAENIIVHCGSGVTACHTLLAIAIADMEIPKLYVGSWSEWSRNDKPMTTRQDV